MTRIVMCPICSNEHAVHRPSPRSTVRANFREALIILAGAVLGLGILWTFMVLFLLVGGRP